jgi:predicted RNase H-like HicB family nuclease
MADDRSYRILVAYDSDKQSFVARIPELDVSASAATRAEAVTEAEHALEQRFAASLAENLPMPPPIDTSPVLGALTIKIADALHRDLLYHARGSGMSAEEYAGQLVARAIGALEGMRRGDRRRFDSNPRPQPQAQQQERTPEDEERGPPRHEERDDRGRDDRGRDDRGGRGDRGRGGNRGRPREGYRPELDDKANFLEYLRGLEKGGGGGRGRR